MEMRQKIWTDLEAFHASQAFTVICTAALDKIADPQLLAKMSVGATDLVRRLFDPDRFLADILAD